MTLAQLVRRSGSNRYKVSSTPTPIKNRWVIKIFDEDGIEMDIKILGRKGIEKSQITPNINVIKCHPKDETGKFIREEIIWIATDKKGLDFDDFVVV